MSGTPSPQHAGDLFTAALGDHIMRAAASVAVAIIAMGLYLALAATLGFTPTWIALGMLAIAATTGIGLVMAGAPPSEI